MFDEEAFYGRDDGEDWKQDRNTPDISDRMGAGRYPLRTFEDYLSAALPDVTFHYNSRTRYRDGMYGSELDIIGRSENRLPDGEEWLATIRYDHLAGAHGLSLLTGHTIIGRILLQAATVAAKEDHCDYLLVDAVRDSDAAEFLQDEAPLRGLHGLDMAGWYKDLREYW